MGKRDRDQPLPSLGGLSFNDLADMGREIEENQGAFSSAPHAFGPLSVYVRVDLFDTYMVRPTEAVERALDKLLRQGLDNLTYYVHEQEQSLHRWMVRGGNVTLLD